MKLNRILVAAMFVVVFAGRPALAQEATYKVVVAPAVQAQFSEVIETFAQVQADPKKTSTIIASITGTVLSMKVAVGDRVAAQDIVAEITTDPVLLAQTLTAKELVRYAQEELAHQERLFAQQLSTRDLVAAAKRDLASAEATLAAAIRLGSDQSVSQAKASAAGLVASVPASPGEQVSQGTILATINDPNAMLIRPGVEPADSRRINPGDMARVSVVTGPSDGKSEGVDLPVATVGSIVDPSSRLVPVTIDISGEVAGRFIVGETVKVSFGAGPASYVSVPRAALEYDGDQAFVFRVDAGKATRLPIQLAGSSDTVIYVREGLSVGDTVVIDGLSGLADGASVEVVAK